MTEIGKLKRVPLREVWKHEAVDFTKWLQDNVDVLNELLGLKLASPERAKPAGSFNVDLVAEDEAGNAVIIENQLERTDHDHLGKLITYLTAIDAKKAIWIAKDPRPEHVAAINWLNESSSADFYVLKLEAVQIGESPPAPLLTLIVGPSAEGRQAGAAKKEIAERYDIRQRFWTDLLKRAKPRTNLHANIRPGEFGWLGTGAGKSGLGLNYSVRQRDAEVELYIDRGKDSDAENLSIFHKLEQSKPEIEQAFGHPLEWDQVEGRRACRIHYRIPGGGYRDEDKWPAIQDAMIDAMVALEKAVKPVIAKL